MSPSVTHIVEAARHLKPSELREVLARLFPVQTAHDGASVWRSIRYSEAARIVAYAPEQEAYLDSLRLLLQQGALSRLDNGEDGTYEVYGADRTYYAVLTPEREFAALLSSWSPDIPPREINLPDESTA